MRIGGPSSPPKTPDYETPAEELYRCVIDAFEASTMLARLSLATALERGERDFDKLPQDVRAMFERVVEVMGLGD